MQENRESNKFFSNHPVPSTLPVENKDDFSGMCQITDLDDNKRKILLRMLSELMEHPEGGFFMPSQRHDTGIQVFFHDLYTTASNLFDNLYKLQLLDYSETSPAPHDTDKYTGKLSITSQNERDLHLAEARLCKIITHVNYQGLIKLHQDGLNLSLKISEILQKHLATRCQFKVSPSGISLCYEPSKAPVYNHLILPLLRTVCKQSRTGLIVDGFTIRPSGNPATDIDWEAFEKIVKEAVQIHIARYKIYEAEELINHFPDKATLARVLGMPPQALHAIQVNDRKEMEISFSGSWKNPGFLQDIRKSLELQRITANIHSSMLIIPFQFRDQFRKLIDNENHFCLLINKSYFHVKSIFHIESSTFLELFRDLSHFYIRTVLDAQLSIYRILRQNYIDCTLEQGGIKISLEAMKEFLLLLEFLAEKSPTKYEFCSTLGIASTQIKYEKLQYILTFPSNNACDDFEKQLNSMKMHNFSKDHFSPIIKIYSTNTLRTFIDTQKYLIEEKKLEAFFLNDYEGKTILLKKLAEYPDAPCHESFLKQQLGEALIGCKEDFFGVSFNIDRESILYDKTVEYLKKLNCGLHSQFGSFSFSLNNRAKWHIICAFECILGNAINIDRILHHDKTIENEVANYVNVQTIQIESQTCVMDSGDDRTNAMQL